MSDTTELVVVGGEETSEKQSLSTAGKYTKTRDNVQGVFRDSFYVNIQYFTTKKFRTLVD